MKKCTSVGNNIKGFSLLETMLAMGVVAITTLSIASFGSFMSSFNKIQGSKTTVYDFKEELITALSSPGYWENIVSKANTAHPDLSQPMNPELACVKNQTVCNEGTYDLTVMNRKDAIRFDAINKAQGFDRNGNICNTFSATQPDPSLRCPFRFEVKWTAICDLGQTSCTNPLIRVSASLVLNRAMPVASNFSIVNLSFYVAADAIPDPVPKTYFRLTNSDVLNFGTSVLPIDMTQAVTYSGAMSTLVFTSATGLSQKGGTVTIVGSTMTYTPPPGYYGKDDIFYQVTSPCGTIINGTIGVGVMTPHTWLGPVAAGPVGRTSNLANFCGKVVNSVCDRSSFPAWPDYHYIFNDLCISCDAVFDPGTLISTLELSDTYTHKVQYSGAPSLSPQGSAIWKKKPVFVQKNGEFCPETGTSSISISNMYGTGWPHTAGEKAFVVSGGKFYGTQSVFGVRVTGSVDITQGTYFHNNGPFIVYSFDDGAGIPMQADLNVINAPGTDFYDFQYNGGGWALGNKVGINIQSSFNVKNDLYISPQANGSLPAWDYDTFCTWEGNAQVPGTFSDGATPIAITVEKNIKVAGYGGKGSRIGCKAPQIKFEGGGLHTVTSAVAPAPVFDTRAFPYMSWGTWLGIRNWIDNGVPHLPFLMIDDPAVSVKFIGPMGFRRGLVNRSDSSLDFSAASLVFASNDPGDVTFTPETKPAAIKNPMQDVFFHPTGGGKLIVGSRQMRMKGKVYSDFDNSTAIAGDGVGGAITEMHMENDFCIGSGANYTQQVNLPFEVRAVLDGTLPQYLCGSDVLSSGFGASQFTPVIKKTAGLMTFTGTLTLLRDFEILQLGGFSSNWSFTVYVPDSGDNTWVHTLNFVAPFQLFALNVDHNIKVPSTMTVGYDTGMGGPIFGSYNTHSTKTVEMGPGAEIRVRTLSIISTSMASAPDKPLRVIGPNPLKFKFQGYSWIDDYVSWNQMITPPGVTVNLPNAQFEVMATGATYGQTQHFFWGSLNTDSYKVNGPIAACMKNAGDVLTVNSMTVGANAGFMWQAATLNAVSTVAAPTGLVAPSSPSYDCNWQSPRWMRGVVPFM